MNETKLLFRNFTVSHNDRCCRDTINSFHVTVLVPEHIEDAEDDVEKQWTEKVNIFIGEAMQKAFNEMVEKVKQEETNAG